VLFCHAERDQEKKTCLMPNQTSKGRSYFHLALHQPSLSAQRTIWWPTLFRLVLGSARTRGNVKRSALREYSIKRVLEWKLRMKETFSSSGRAIFHVNIIRLLTSSYKTHVSSWTQSVFRNKGAKSQASRRWQAPFFSTMGGTPHLVKVV
jgi:hypothetical protein